MAKTRRHYSPPEKAAILREHLIDQASVSDLCDKYGIHFTLFYLWQRTLFENLPFGAAPIPGVQTPKWSCHQRQEQTIPPENHPTVFAEAMKKES